MIIVAAGQGTRLGASVHKALVQLAGRPLVEHTLRRAVADERLAPLVLVGHPDDRGALGAIVRALDRPVIHVDGGARRQDSVQAGLEALGDRALGDTAPDVVLVHDGARPFFPRAPLDDLAQAALTHGCALLATPVTDTIKRQRDDTPPLVDRTIPRDDLWGAQTPQAFVRAELVSRLDDARRVGRSVTDEATLFETDGDARRVALVPGSPWNFKVTTPHDLALADALLASPSPAIQEMLR